MKANGLYIGLGTGAVRIGLGFKPRKVKVVQVGTANLVTTQWDRDMARSATGAGGIVRAGVGNTPGFVLLAAGAGIRQYGGGDIVAAATLADQVAAEMVAGYMGSLQGGIKRWTLGHEGNRTGNVDVNLDTAKCGVGSMVEIEIQGGRVETAAIVALSNYGKAANEVTLDRAVHSGRVRFIGPKTDFVAAPAGTVMPAGFELLDTTYANAAATVFAFEAED
jgi:hypothetical protein